MPALGSQPGPLDLTSAVASSHAPHSSQFCYEQLLDHFQRIGGAVPVLAMLLSGWECWLGQAAVEFRHVWGGRSAGGDRDVFLLRIA